MEPGSVYGAAPSSDRPENNERARGPGYDRSAGALYPSAGRRPRSVAGRPALAGGSRAGGEGLRIRAARLFGIHTE